VIPKLDGSKDMYITREQYVAAYKNYAPHYEETKNETIRSLQKEIYEQRLAAQKQAQEQKMAQQTEKGQDAVMTHEFDAEADIDLGTIE